MSLVVLVVVALHGLASLQTHADADRQRFESDLELQARLEGLRTQDAWTARAEQAEAALSAMRDRMPEVANTGLAQAELQAWLTELASSSALQEPRIRVEDTLDVPGHPDMWQVLARLDGRLPQYGQGALLRALSDALPWVQAERVEIGDGESPQVSLVVRAYYRRSTTTVAPAVSGMEDVSSQEGTTP
ncbi:hypothetical protein E2F49_12300 [Luteimonas terrae]|uniref:Fimbrial protein n=1 Tax=Luteimonas terrae TaxID=1530191 RepID=A0A4R5U6S9_9GAMM|nr:hypothetical protein E2F49_12300 [Luteimonas terrae]